MLSGKCIGFERLFDRLTPEARGFRRGKVYQNYHYD
jgi:hypothetical protein